MTVQANYTDSVGFVSGYVPGGSYTVDGKQAASYVFKDENATLSGNEDLLVYDPDAGSDLLAHYTGYKTEFGDPILYVDDLLTYIVYTNNPGNYVTGATGASVSGDFTLCFVEGTRVATPVGQRPVEELAIGDQVLNTQGEAVTVKWMGRQTRHPAFAKLTDKMPIRIQQGALGGGLPLRDLFVSPDHAMLVDGVLAHAGALVNGRTITQVQTWEGNVEYFHIETESHELVLAEGAASETFIDNVSRKEFDNYAEFEALYPNAQPMVEMELPRVKFARQLPRAISRRLAAVADELLGKQAIAA